MLTVSVVIPVYKDPVGLKRALESVLAQTYKPLEVLVCDDGSPDADFDAIGEVVLELRARGLGVDLYRQANAGAGAARNRCIAKARGDVIAFLDSDDWWMPEKLARSVAVLEESGAVLVAHNFKAVKEGEADGVVWDCAAIARRKDWLNPKGDARVQYFYRGFIGILTVVVRREALLRAGGFDAAHRYALDWECWHAVLAANEGSFFKVFDEVLACYTLSSGGLTSKGLARVAERESYLPRYVRGVARHGGIWWPLLLIRGWLTIQLESVQPEIRRRDWGNVGRLLLRMPVGLGGCFWRTLRGEVDKRGNGLTG